MKNDTQFRFAFTTKVMIPVIGIMVGLVAVTNWLIQDLITGQAHRASADRLMVSEQTYVQLSGMQDRELSFRYRAIPSDPRFKALAQLAAQKGDRQTLRGVLLDIAEELNASFIQYYTSEGVPFVGVSREQPGSTFQEPVLSPSAVAGVISGNSLTTPSTLDGRVYRVVAVPVEISQEVRSALAVGNELTSAKAMEINGLIGCGIAFLVDGNIVVTSFRQPGIRRELERKMESNLPPLSTESRIHPVVLDDEHFLMMKGAIDAGERAASVSYILFFNYEPQLRTLQETQRRLAVMGLFGIVLGSLVAG